MVPLDWTARLHLDSKFGLAWHPLPFHWQQREMECRLHLTGGSNFSSVHKYCTPLPILPLIWSVGHNVWERKKITDTLYRIQFTPILCLVTISSSIVARTHNTVYSKPSIAYTLIQLRNSNKTWLMSSHTCHVFACIALSSLCEWPIDRLLSSSNSIIFIHFAGLRPILSNHRFLLFT